MPPRYPTIDSEYRALTSGFARPRLSYDPASFYSSPVPRPTLAPPLPEESASDKYLRLAREGLAGVTGLVSMPFRGLGMLASETQDLFAGAPAEGPRVRLTPDSGPLGDFTGASAVTPTVPQMALEGYRGLAQAGAEAITGEQYLDPNAPSGVRGEEFRPAIESGFPGLSRAEAFAEPVAELGLQFATDPALAGLGRLGALAKAGSRPAAVAERAIGASFVPGMAEGAYHQFGEASQAAGEQGMFSPAAIRAGVGGTLEAGLAGLGAYHAIRPSIQARRPRGVDNALPVDRPPVGPPLPTGDAATDYLNRVASEAREPVMFPEEPAAFPETTGGSIIPSPIQPRPFYQDATVAPQVDPGAIRPPSPELRPEGTAKLPQSSLMESTAPAGVPPEQRMDVGLRGEVQKYLDANPNASREELAERILSMDQQLKTDPLTGLGSKRALLAREAEVAQDPSARYVSSDLKGFKAFNDILGHSQADKVLKSVGSVFAKHFGADTFRPMGDEFIGIVRGITDEVALASKIEQIRSDLREHRVQLRAPDGRVVDIPGLEAHIGFGKTLEEADLAANQDRTRRGSGRPAEPEPAGGREGGPGAAPAVEGTPGEARPRLDDRPTELAQPSGVPSFRQWLGDRRVPMDPNYNRALRDEYLSEFPDADRAQFQPAKGERKPAFQGPAGPGGSAFDAVRRAQEEAREIVPDADVEADLRENVLPALQQGVRTDARRAGINSRKPELGIENVPGDPRDLARAIKKDADNPKYLELKEARRQAIADERASFDPAQFDPESQGAEAPKYATAYHGSPHDFDKFDSSKIGTGEGAQVYGHGLYFSGKKEIAEHYRNALSEPRVRLDGGEARDVAATLADKSLSPEERDVLNAIINDGDARDIPKALATRAKHYELAALTADQYARDRGEDLSSEPWDSTSSEDLSSDPSVGRFLDLEAAAKSLARRITPERSGKLYEVDLKPAEDDYLLWDKPLSEQSEKVKAALVKMGYDENALGGQTGAEFYRAFDRADPEVTKRLGVTLSSDAATSQTLKSIGIPGIKYLDGSSRGKVTIEKVDSDLQMPWRVMVDGDAKSRHATEAEAKAHADSPELHNYVLFDDSLVTTTAKYAVRPSPGQRGLEGIAEDQPAIEARRRPSPEDVVEPTPLRSGQTYFNGDLAEYTGRTERLHGGTFHEIKFLEGAKKGETRLTQAPPAPEQKRMFGGEMLQGVEARVTEGREGEGALFRQDDAAQAKKDREAQGGIKFAKGESPTAKVITTATVGREQLRARIKETFPTLEIRESKGGYTLPTRSGRRILIKPEGSIEFNRNVFVGGHGPKAAERVASGELRIAGATYNLGRDSLIRIVDKGVLPHESLHVFLDHFATPRERGTIQREFAAKAKAEGRNWQETAGDDYNGWFDGRVKPSGRVATFFQAIKDFFSRIREVFAPTAEGVFKKVASGEAFERAQGISGKLPVTQSVRNAVQPSGGTPVESFAVTPKRGPGEKPPTEAPRTPEGEEQIPKRLEPDAFRRAGPDEYVLLYHGTSAENAGGILAGGFRKGFVNEASGTPRGAHASIYVTPDVQTAHNYTDDGTVLAIKVRKRDLHPDNTEETFKSVHASLYEAYSGAARVDYGRPVEVVGVFRLKGNRWKFEPHPEQPSPPARGEPKYATAPKPIRPIPPEAEPGKKKAEPIQTEVSGRPVEPGETPRVEQRVEGLRQAEKSVGEAPKELDRDTKQRWESLEPEVKKILREYDDERFFNVMKRRSLDAAEVQAWDSRVRGKEERLSELKEQVSAERVAGRPDGEASRNLAAASFDYIAAQRAAVNDGTGTARALAARARVMDASRTPDDRFLRQVFKEIPKVTDKQATELVHAFREDPDSLLPLLHAAIGHGKIQKALEWYKAGLLSAFSTDVANFSGNLAEHHIRLAETGMAAQVDKLLQWGYGGERTRFKGEAGAEWAGGNLTFGPALHSLGRNLWSVFSLKDKTIDLNRRLEHQVGAIGGTTGKVIRTSFGKLEAMDRFFKDWGGGAESGKLAYRKAARELGEGASKDKIRERFSEIMQEMADPENTDHSDLLRAVASAKEFRTFQERRAESATESVMQFVKRHPLLGFALPFVRTPGNIAHAILERSPVGFKKAHEVFRKFREVDAAHKAGKATAAEFADARGQLADALVKPLLGTAILGGFAAYAKAGGMTGSGPVDPREKNLLKDTGWQPYSFVIPTGDGKKAYVPFNRFEPVSSILGFAADMAELGESKTAGDLFEKGLGSVVQNLTSKSYLQGLSNAAALISRPTEFADDYARQFAGGWVPNIFGRLASAVDPKLRDTRPSSIGIAGMPEAIGKTILSRIPGASMLLPERRSGTGEPIERTGGEGLIGGLQRFVLPTQISATKENRDLEALLVELEAVPSAPRREVGIPGGRGKKVRLTQDEYDLLQDADQKATTQLRRIVASQQFKRLDPIAQKNYIRRAYQRAGTTAERRLWSRPDLRKRASEIIRSPRA